MAGKAKLVPIATKAAGSQVIRIEEGATRGATLGLDLFMPDGTKIRAEDILNKFVSGKPTLQDFIIWKQLAEVPANVRALAAAAGTGLFAITGPAVGAFRAITNAAGETTVSNGDGVAGNPVVGLADVAPSAGGTLQLTTFDAKGRRSHEGAATTDNLPEGVTNLYFTAARVRATVLTGLSTATNAVITAADSVLSALGNLQAQISAIITSLSGYVPTTRTISTTAPLAGGGNLSANRTLTISAATTGAAGSMSAADKAKLDTVVSGTYAPTPSGVSNVASVTARTCLYSRNGSVVSVAVVIDCAASSSGLTTTVSIPLPIASNFTGAAEATGSAATAFGVMGDIFADAASDTAYVRFIPTVTTTQTYRGVFMYLIA